MIANSAHSGRWTGIPELHRASQFIESVSPSDLRLPRQSVVSVLNLHLLSSSAIQMSFSYVNIGCPLATCHLVIDA